jgi:hypothetical protein
MLTHVAERFQLFPSMGWGQPDSPRHYIDLVSAILGCTLLALGLLGKQLALGAADPSKVARLTHCRGKGLILAL